MVQMSRLRRYGEDLMSSITWQNLGAFGIALLLALLLYVATYVWFARLTPYRLAIELDQANIAVGATFAGFLAGMACVLSAAFEHAFQRPPGRGFVALLVTWVAGLLLLTGGARLFSLLLFYDVGLATREILHDRNSAVGVALGGFLFGLGLIMRALWVAGVVWWQIIAYLVLTVLLYAGSSRWFDWVTPYRLGFEMHEQDNPAVGMNLGGYYLGVAFVIAAVVSGEGTGSLLDNAVAIVFWSFIGLLGQTIVDRLFELVTPFKATAAVLHRNLAVGIALGTSGAVIGYLISVIIA